MGTYNRSNLFKTTEIKHSKIFPPESDKIRTEVNHSILIARVINCKDQLPEKTLGFNLLKSSSLNAFLEDMT